MAEELNGVAPAANDTSLPDAGTPAPAENASPAAPARNSDPFSEDGLSAIYDQINQELAEEKAAKDTAKPGKKTEAKDAKGKDTKFEAKPATDEAAAATDDTENTDAKPEGEAEGENVDQPTDGEGKPETAIAAPDSWSAEMKGQWASLSPDVQQYVVGRERDAHAKISELGTELSALKPLGELREELQAFSDQHGLPFEEATKRLYRVQNMMDENPSQTLIALAKTYGVQLVDAASLRQRTAQQPSQPGQQPPVNGQQPTAQPHDPRLASLEQQLSQTQAALIKQQRERTAQEMQERRQADAWAANEIATWSQGKEHYDAVKADMAEMLSTGVAKTLDQAYDLAIYRNPDVRAKAEAERKAAEQEAARQAEAERAEAERKAREQAVKDAERARRVATNDRPGTPAPNGDPFDPEYLSRKYDQIAAGSA